jgi:hypothetical protein
MELMMTKERRMTAKSYVKDLGFMFYGLRAAYRSRRARRTMELMMTKTRRMRAKSQPRMM